MDGAGSCEDPGPLLIRIQITLFVWELNLLRAGDPKTEVGPRPAPNTEGLIILND